MEPIPPGLTWLLLVFAEVVGVGCVLDGVRYTNGESFQPNCRYNCTCIDGTVGCTPLCLSPRPPRIWCRHPRHVRIPGQCCELWVCDDDVRRPRQTALLDIRAFGKCGQGQVESLDSSEPLMTHKSSPPGHYPPHNSTVTWSCLCSVWDPSFPSVKCKRHHLSCLLYVLL